MNLNKVLVVYKRSTYDLYHNEEYDKNVKKMINEGHIAVKTLKESHNIHQMTVDTIIEELSMKGIQLDVIFRGDLKPIENYDLVITTGGDGTVLETSKYTKEIPILGVNSDPLGSVGFFTGANKDNFTSVLNSIFDNTIETTNINRIQLYLNDEKIKELALNDILITHSIPAATSRYIIKNNGQEEAHRSSGIWISTAAGSTGAIRSAGGTAMDIKEESFQYLVREFYDRGGKEFKFLKGLFTNEDEFEIISQMRLGRIYIDGPYFDYHFTIGDVLKLKKSPYPLKLLGFDYLKRAKFLKNQ
ncbi:MAG: NAD(+)/NADH kinase [Candidatus Sericytochromatia bacterium]